MLKQLFVATVALTAYTACSDTYLSEVDNSVPGSAISGETSANSFVLTDANGQKVTKVSPDYGIYYLDIKTDGMWYIEATDNMEFTPTRSYGNGSARVPVVIANNWADARQLTYNVKFLNDMGATRRAPDASDDTPTTQTVDQEANSDLEKFKKIVSSNLFVGFGYNPEKNIIPELCTGIEIFKMDSINAPELKLVASALAPQAVEEYYYATSEESMDKLVHVKGNAGGNFGSVKLKLDANVNVTNSKKSGSMTVQKSLIRSVYSRELHWANALVGDKYYSEGFKYYKQRFIDQIKLAKDSVQKAAAAKEFFSIVGTHFISKSMLGCQMDYRMTVDSSKATTATSVKAALDLKWQQQVKDTAKVDSATQENLKKLVPDSLRKNFVFNGNVQVTDSAFSAASSTKASVKVRGGAVEKVNILATGGTLKCDDLAEWLLGAAPEKATMVGITNHPIYVLFKDDKEGDEKNAHDFLQKIIDANYNLDPQ